MSFLGDIVGGIGSLFGLGGGGGGLVPSDITLHLKDIDPIQIDRVSNIDPFKIDRVKNIAPIATHIKEINNIDPILVDSFNVSEVRNIEPLRVQQFHVTNLPHVNLSLRQMPPVDLNIRRVPPLSVGIHQNFRVPSHYTISTQLLGLEVMRVTLQGESVIVPHDKYHREQSRTAHRSQAEPAAVGNAAIPARHLESFPGSKPTNSAAEKLDAERLRYEKKAAHPGIKRGGLSIGMP